MRTPELAWQNFNFTIKLFVFCPRNPTDLADRVAFSAASWKPNISRVFWENDDVLANYQNWLVVEPTHLKNISQNGNLPQIGMKMKNIWNHHLRKESSSHTHQFFRGRFVSFREGFYSSLNVPQCPILFHLMMGFHWWFGLVVWIPWDPLMKGIVT